MIKNKKISMLSKLLNTKILNIKHCWRHQAITPTKEKMLISLVILNIRELLMNNKVKNRRNNKYKSHLKMPIKLQELSKHSDKNANKSQSYLLKTWSKSIGKIKSMKWWEKSKKLLTKLLKKLYNLEIN